MIKSKQLIGIGDRLECIKGSSSKCVLEGDIFTVKGVIDDKDEMMFTAVSNNPEMTYTFCTEDGEIQCRFWGHSPAIFKKL